MPAHAVTADQLADAIIVIVVFVAALINGWQHRKTRAEANGQSSSSTTRE